MQTGQTTGWLKRNWFQLTIALSALVVAGSLFYYYVVRTQQVDDPCRRIVFWGMRIEGCDPK